MKKIIGMMMGVTAVVGAFGAQPATTNYYWIETSGEGFSGSYTNTAHWDTGVVPTYTNTAYFSIKKNGTVTLPEGDNPIYANMRWSIAPSAAVGTVFTWDGSAGVLRLPSCDKDNYRSEPFGFNYSGTHYFNLQGYDISEATRYKIALATITGGVFRVSRPTADCCLQVDFDRGFYNFYDPEGTASATYFIIANNTCGSNLRFVFHDGAHIRYPKMQVVGNLYNENQTLLLDFAGGTNEVMAALDILPVVSYPESCKGLIFLQATNGALFSVAGSTTIGGTSGSAYNGGKSLGNRRVNFLAEGENSRMLFKKNFTQNDSRLTMTARDGGLLSFTNAYFGATANTHLTLEVTNATLASSGEFFFGNSNHTNQDLIANFTDATINTKMTRLSNARITAKNCHWINSSTFYPGYYNTNAIITIDGGTLSISNQTDIGRESGTATLILTNGAYMSVANASMFVPNNEGTEGHLDMTDAAVDLGTKANSLYIGNKGFGTLRIGEGACITSCAFCVANASTATGIVELVDGGSVYTRGVKVGSSGGMARMTQKGGSLILENGCSFAVGYSGLTDARYEMQGGEAICEWMYLGQSSYSHSYSEFKMTGGTFTCRLYDDDRKDVGVKICDSSSSGPCTLILNGGTLKAYHIFANYAQNGGQNGKPVSTAHAALLADGGTIETSQTSDKGLICYLDEARAGEKGLTINAVYSMYLPQDIANLTNGTEEVDGLLCLKGAEMKYLTSTNTTVARISVEGGTACFAPTLLKTAPTYYSAFTVKNSATLSMAGDVTEMTLADLTLGDTRSIGYLEMDTNDTLVVTGAFNVVNGTLKLTDAVNENDTFNLIKVKGNQAASLPTMLSRLSIYTTTGDAFDYTFTCTYDSESDMTTIQAKAVEKGSRTTISWRGTKDNAWETAANWKEGALPTANNVALFDSENALTYVTNAALQGVSAINFTTTTGYVLAGETIVMSDYSQTNHFAVTAGAHIISNEVQTMPNVPLAVRTDSGTSLTLDGTITSTEFDKTGKGILTLSAANAIADDLRITNGVVHATCPEAIGDSILQIRLFSGMLDMDGAADGTETEYRQRDMIVLQNNVRANPISMRVTGNVTIPMFSNCGGAFVKDGPGRLTLNNEKSYTMTLSCADGSSGDWWPPDGGKAVLTRDENGLIPDDRVMAGATVLEGELRLTGCKNWTYGFNAKTYFLIGAPCTPTDGRGHISAAPALTLDSARVYADESGKHILLGAGLSDDNSDVTDVYLTLTNNSYLACNSLYVARGATKQGVRHHISVTDSKLTASYITHANCNTSSKSLSTFEFRNSTHYAGGQLNLPGRSTFLYDNSILKGKNDSLPIVITYNHNFNTGDTYSGGDFIFQNGSYVYLTNITACGGANLPTTLTFDNAEWVPVLKDGSGTTPFKPDSKVKIYMRNKGAIFKPTSGNTWTFADKLEGDGNIVMQGEGTLAFTGTETLAIGGTVRIVSGTVDVAAGALAAGVTFEGPGKLTGTFTTPPVLKAGDDTTWVDITGATFNNGVRIDCEGDGTTGIAKVVACYTGDTAPSLVGWRTINTSDESVSGRFKAENGKIYCTLKRHGLTVIVR